MQSKNAKPWGVPREGRLLLVMRLLLGLFMAGFLAYMLLSLTPWPRSATLAVSGVAGTVAVPFVLHYEFPHKVLWVGRLLNWLLAGNRKPEPTIAISQTQRARDNNVMINAKDSSFTLNGLSSGAAQAAPGSDEAHALGILAVLRRRVLDEGGQYQYVPYEWLASDLNWPQKDIVRGVLFAASQGWLLQEQYHGRPIHTVQLTPRGLAEAGRRSL